MSGPGVRRFSLSWPPGGVADRLVTVGFVLAALVFSFVHLGRADLRMWDESENALVVHETLRTGGAVPHLSGRPYFDKPPLWYGSAAVSVALLGFDERALRLPAAVAGFLLLLLVYRAGRRFFSPVAGLAAGLFVMAVRQLWFFKPSGIFSTHHLRSADGDALMILFAFGAFLAFARAVREEGRGLLAAAVLSGLGVMAKGPVALAPALGFALFQAVSPARARLTKRGALGAIALFAAVVVPWHLAMLLVHRDAFLTGYVLRMVARVGEGLEAHRGPTLYYLEVLSNREVFFGGALLLVAAAAVLWDGRRLSAFERGGVLLILAVLLVGLTAVSTKIAWYIEPLYPFGALVVAAFVRRLEEGWTRGEERPWIRRASGVALAVVLLFEGAHAARNLKGLASTPVGRAHAFFTEALGKCPDDLLYSDERRSVEIRYRLVRYGVAAGDPSDSRCFIVRTDTVLAESVVRSSVEVLRGGGFILRERVAPESR